MKIKAYFIIMFCMFIQLSFAQNEDQETIQFVLTLSSEGKLKNKGDIFGDVISLIPAGSKVGVYSKSDDYYKINHNGKTGYINEVYFGDNPVPQYTSNDDGIQYCLTLLSDGKLKDKGDVFGDVVSLIPAGTKVDVYSKHVDYYKIKYNEKVGYINEVYFGNNPIHQYDFDKEDIQYYLSTSSEGKLKNKGEVLAEVICNIPPGSNVPVFSYKNGYYKVKYEKKIGFLSEVYIEKNSKSPYPKKQNETSTPAPPPSRFTHGNPIRVISNVGFIADWRYKNKGSGYGGKRIGFYSTSIIENRNTKPVAVYNAYMKYNFQYTLTYPSGKVQEKNRYAKGNFPQLFLLAPNTWVKETENRLSFSHDKYSDFRVNENNIAVSGNVYEINNLESTNGLTKVTTYPAEIKDINGVKILISFYKTAALRPKGSSTFYKYVPLITVKNTTASKVKLKGSITFDIYYSGYKQNYAINLGRINPGETEENKGLGDRSPAMNWTPEIYIGNIEYPTVEF